MKNIFAFMFHAGRKRLAAGLWFAALAVGTLPAAEVVLVPAGFHVPGGSPGWRYRLGTSEASVPREAWRTNIFVEDGTWSTGALPLGYPSSPANDPNGYEAAIVTTVPSSTAGNYLSVFLRKTFVITNRAAYSDLTLSVVVDDGVVAWINGKEVMRFQCCTGGGDPSAPSYDAASTSAAESAGSTSTIINDASGPLIDGTNVLTLQLFNANLPSTDIVVDALLKATVDETAPVIVGQSPAPGTVQQLTAVQVNFSESVMGVDASDLLINGTPATNLLAISPSIYTWEFAQPGTGVVSVAFAPGHGITDLSAAANPFGGASWNYNLVTNLMLPQFFITEFMADNSGKGINGIRDEDGDSSDWIEIHNSQGSVGNIGGWFLTDNATNLTKWRIPNGVTIPGNGYLVVFASGKNRTNAQSRLHTNFQLNNSGEYLGLVNPATNVISEFSPVFPPQQEDISYGRDRLDTELLGFYTTPTPGSNNVVSGVGFGPEVRFSRAGGSFAGSFQLTLSVDDTNTEIRYTLVNTAQSVVTATNIPTRSSTLYTGPITVNDTVQVRARAFKTSGNFFPGPPRTECYIALGNGATNFVSTLPIVVIHTMGPTAVSGGYPTPDNSIIVACFDNTNNGIAVLNGPPQMVKRGGINLRGSSTQGFPKSSFAVELWDEFNEDEEASMAGLPKESDWVLYAPNQFDLSMMHNPFMHRVAREMGYYSSRTRFVEVFYRNGSGPLTVNTNSTGANMGDYYGMFVLEEKVKRDGNRVDINELQLENTNYPSITGGYLMKVDRTDGNERTFSGGGMTINYQDPDGLEMVTPSRSAQAAYIKGYLDSMNTGLQGTSLTNIASTNHYSNYIDIDHTMDLHIVNVLVMNADAYRLSGYLYKPRNGKLVFGPLWDVDRGLGTSRGDQRTFHPRAWQSHDASSCGGTDYGTDFFGGSLANTWTWLNRLFSDVDFWQRWVDRYQNWRTSVLDTNHIAAIVDDFGNQIRAVQPRESKRWGGNGASDTNPRVGNVANCTGAFTHNFPGTYQGEVDFQKRWLLEHLNFMDTNLLNRPQLNTQEGQLPLGSIITLIDATGKPGTAIYFTLDGSDPRGFQGRTNPAAILYTQPITITNNVRIRARAVNSNHRNLTGTLPSGSRNPIVSTPWSGDIAATYFITPPPLVVTELMYHPEPSADPDQDPDDFEYVELKNVGTNALNLIGFRFTNGIDFTFTAGSAVTTLAAGDHVLIVKNIAAFTSRYGVHTNIAGAYGGSLDNGGERLTLVGPALEPILDFVYHDDWYALSDGFGFSLVIKDPNAPLNSWDERNSWRISSVENGSPGVTDPPPPNIPAVLVNEALTHTDLPAVDVIELYNPGASPVNIGGWYLTDDPGEPKKYEIPANYTIPAGGYALFDESQFNTGLHAFSLESDGDEVYLYSALGGLLTGYAHGFSYGAAQNGVTFGRYVTSLGEEHFVAQATNSLGSANSLPRVGPLVISEIQFHPPDTLVGGVPADNALDEFIEIQNLTGTNVALYDTAHPSNTWRITKAVTFDFPTNASLAGSNLLLVVSFDPATNASQLAAFRAKYDVSPTVPIYGPYSGKLDNSSESIRLRRPDTPNTNGVPYIIVDQIDYRADAPWPKAADGTGASLQRLVSDAYGNDPTNWIAARPTAGEHFIGGALPTIVQNPVDATTFAGATTQFTAQVDGVGVAVQWRFNGDAIPGATNLTLTLSDVDYGQAGLYDLVAYTSGGAVFSSVAHLAVLAPLTFTIHPMSQNVVPGTNVTLTASAFGAGTVRYQWQYEGTNVPNATNSSFSFSNASLSFGHGTWNVIATDDFNTKSSSNAFIFVLIRPGYVQQPRPVTVLQGQDATFSVIVTGAPPIYYRWIRGGVPYVTNDVGYFTFTNVLVSTSVRVAVTNLATGLGGVNSSTVQLTVLADNDRDGMADIWEAQFGFNTNDVNDAELDLDGDGMRNRDEYIAGTDPTDPLSFLKLVPSATNNALLQFTAQSNISYSVQFSTNLLGSPVTTWAVFTNVAPEAEVRTIDVPVPKPPPDPARFYRIITPGLP